MHTLIRDKKKILLLYMVEIDKMKCIYYLSSSDSEGSKKFLWGKT
jgi:hypothetical protein